MIAIPADILTNDFSIGQTIGALKEASSSGVSKTWPLKLMLGSSKKRIAGSVKALVYFEWQAIPQV